MYFTETDPASCENPLDLDADFEEQYDTGEYELKISRLFHNTHQRLKQEDPEKLRNWNEALQTLRKGDHYILVLLNVDSELARQGLRIWVVLAWGIGLGIALVLSANAGDYLEPLLEQVLINALTGKVGSSTNLSGNPTNQELDALELPRSGLLEPFADLAIKNRAYAIGRTTSECTVNQPRRE